MDSAFYGAEVAAAIRRGGAFFSVTARMDAKVRAAIAVIPEDAWTAISYPRAIWDDQLRAWISDAEVAEIEYTAFASKKGKAVTARLVVRDLIEVAARIARHGREHITLHLPEGWHREHEWMTLFHAATGPPAAAA